MLTFYSLLSPALASTILFSVFMIFFFFLSIVDLQSCVNFHCTVHYSVTHTYTFSIFFSIHGLPQDIKCSLCYMGGPYCLFSIFMILATLKCFM